MIEKSQIPKLIELCKGGDRNAQHKVYKSYYDRYYTLCLRYLGTPDMASDVVNQAFYKVFTNIRSLKDTGLFEGWMKQVFINTCLNELKKLKRMSHEDIEAVGGADVPHSLNEGVSNLTMEELLDMVQRLPTRMRMVFNLYVIDGYNHREISRQLDISVGTSKFHLNQARSELKRMIEAQSTYQIQGNSHG